MSLLKSEDSKKWINAFVAILSFIVGYIVISFTEQMGEWFDLEAKVSNFLMVTQAIGIIAGLATFLGITKNKNASTHLNEVYMELTKAVWPQADAVLKSTVGIIIGLSIISGIFVGVDFLFQKALELIY